MSSCRPRDHSLVIGQRRRDGGTGILYETDFPHPTSMSPGPASDAVAPNLYLETTFGDLPEATLRKILHDNAARIYHLD